MKINGSRKGISIVALLVIGLIIQLKLEYNNYMVRIQHTISVYLKNIDHVMRRMLWVATEWTCAVI